MDVRIRAATPEDARAIATVHVESWRSAYRDLMPAAYLAALSVEERTATWARSIPLDAAKRKRTLVAERDGAVVASANVGPNYGDHATGMLFLMYALESAWGTGTGRALMQASREAMIDLGFERAVLWVLEKNARARRFYEADGWQPDGETSAEDYGRVSLVALRYATELDSDEPTN